MGVAGLMFEAHPPNFENLYNFWRCLNGIKSVWVHPPFWSTSLDRIRQDQTGSDRIRHDQTWSKVLEGSVRIGQYQTGSDRIRQDQTGSDRIRQDQTGSDMIRHVRDHVSYSIIFINKQKENIKNIKNNKYNLHLEICLDILKSFWSIIGDELLIRYHIYKEKKKGNIWIYISILYRGWSKTSLKIFKHYKLKPSFLIFKDEKAKDKVGVGDKPQFQQFDHVWSNLIKFDPI